MCQLYALQQKGKLILRIEDTDTKRSVPGGLEGIIFSLDLLGIKDDEGPVSGGDFGPYVQTERLDIYKKYSDELIEKDHAYRCFCTAERLATLKEEQTITKQKRQYDGKCRHLSAEEIQANLDAGMPYVVRMRVPENEDLPFDDLALGHIVFNTNEVNDQVLMKANGIPTYHLAVVVDDHLMGITTVHRGAEWLSSTPKQILLYRYFGWDMPETVHVPLLLGQKGQGKLSKRKGNVAVLDYLRNGYIKEGFINCLMLVGWSPDPKVARPDEIYDFDFFVQNFDHSRIKKSGGRLSAEKFDAINAVWLAKLSGEELYDRTMLWIKLVEEDTVVDQMRGITEELADKRKKAGEIKAFFEADKARAVALLDIIKLRMKRLTDVYDWLSVLWNGSSDFDRDSIALVLPDIEKQKEIVYNLRVALEKLTTWNQEEWEPAIRALADSYGMKHGDLFMVLRVIVTGKKVSPPLREFMVLAGRDFVARRFEKFATV
jgi:nondiscriminating glutamyl-tRNA synthetase